MDESTFKETIYSSSKIVLFGRDVDDLAVVSASRNDDVLSKAAMQFARIYGFTVNGFYTELATPVLFLVKGKSEPAASMPVPGPNPRDKKFFDDLRAWTVDQSTETVRLDVDQGKFEDVLLAAAVEGLDATGRVSGAKVSGAKVSGAKVSGAKMSGARISGARD